MMKLKNILVPHAGTPGGDIALRKAIYFAKLSGATTNRIKSDMEHAMKRRATLCHSKNINATYKVSVGLPEQEIIKFARYYNTDLIIMSKRRKIRGFKGILKLGSVSRKIL